MPRDPRLRRKHSRVKMMGVTWSGQKEFLMAQAQVAVILALAHVGNTWPNTYPRNDNHNPLMFWVINIILLVVSILTLKHDEKGSARGVQLLSRPQTEEWKGWMQFAFIMYHYYRQSTMRSVSLSLHTSG
jgi:N-acetylneuraminate 9-O-acetyltransferase